MPVDRRQTHRLAPTAQLAMQILRGPEPGSVAQRRVDRGCLPGRAHPSAAERPSGVSGHASIVTAPAAGSPERKEKGEGDGPSMGMGAPGEVFRVRIDSRIRRSVVGLGVSTLVVAGGLAATAGSAAPSAGHALRFPSYDVQLTAGVGSGLRPGHAFPVFGVVRERDTTTGALGAAVPADVHLVLHDAAGQVLTALGTVSADSTGELSLDVPAAATAGYHGPQPLEQQVALGLDAVSVRGSSGTARRAGTVEVP